MSEKIHRQGSLLKHHFAKKPFFVGIGDVMDRKPHTRYLTWRANSRDIEDAWRIVGKSIFDAAEKLGTVPVSCHSFDLRVKEGKKYTVGRVFECKGRAGRNRTVTVYKKPLGYVFVAVDDHEEAVVSPDLEDAGQMNWLDQESLSDR